MRDFILQGLLFCQEEKIRENFKHFLYQLSRSIFEALSLNLKLLSDKFALISAYPCRQFFSLFTELIDFYFMQQSVGAIKDSTVIDPE